MKKRLDVLLVERGLAESRTQAQALVIAGLVPGYEKPGQQVDETATLELKERPAYVSRGGEKLAHALDALGVDPAGLDCLDVGASTGGFTDVLLQRGAARVIALDVGYGQLHERLRADPRVTVLERTNARALERAPVRARARDVRRLVHLRLRRAAAGARGSRAPGWQALVLVKPQFEAGRGEVRQGRRRPRPRRARARRARRGRGGARLGGEHAGSRRLGLPGPEGQPGVLPPPRAGRRPDPPR